MRVIFYVWVAQNVWLLPAILWTVWVLGQWWRWLTHCIHQVLLSLCSHKMVLVSGPTSGSPAHYLDPEDKILSVKAGAPPTAMFILCVNMPGQVPLEILDSIRNNVSY